MNNINIFNLLLFFPFFLNAQELGSKNQSWIFKQAGNNVWHKATVPGNIHTDLLNNKLIPDPFYETNEKQLHWIDTVEWEYKTSFTIPEKNLNKENIDLVFDGLDTYAHVYVNGKRVLAAANMFVQYAVNIKPYISTNNNELRIVFRPAWKISDSIAAAQLPVILPDNNRVYTRKAAFQFGWDWAPVFTSCGIWKKIWIDAWDNISQRQQLQIERDRLYTKKHYSLKLVQEKDSMGESFYFTKNGKPLYMKGANYIPADVFLSRVKKEDYRRLLLAAKDANMNMLRVWGGGIYEADEFYDLCDSLGIYVWQDFMFAGAMYPGDDAFMQNVKTEITQQVKRLRHHPSIVLWCGNNEIEEAWHHWGWQKHFNIHGADSVRIKKDYDRLFKDSLRIWVNELDIDRPYISTSPRYGWGNPQSYTHGDSHYWGLWWGLEPWEKFYEKTGRFVSEYGMQSMPTNFMVNQYAAKQEQHRKSVTILNHQKATDGFYKLDHYLQYYFIDSARLQNLGLEKYIYLTNCLQYYILKNSISIHLAKKPANMGSLIWQLNDCWPVTSWSLIDYKGGYKGGWYAAKESFAEGYIPTPDTIKPKEIALKNPQIRLKRVNRNTIELSSSENAYYVSVYSVSGNLNPSENYFHLVPNQPKRIRINTSVPYNTIKMLSLFDIRVKD